ncbi:MAG: putative 8-oxo-dGTP diphosphatase YtkD [Parcubacteria group bacterium ADurb.Bin316]|nr:MAG: putative 8-oxo-dGTP diphosphatase YtkD [Parcubacteria group bacterium ADurb.Bin316]HOZ55869.1 NUDIX hydrolase [bacterium]
MSKAKKEKIIGQDINKNKVELDVSKMKFRPSVYGVLIENDKVLLSKQWDGYDFPGGAMEIDETIEEALVREFKEETGLEIKVLDVIECRHDFWLTPFTEDHCNSILMYYLVEKIGGEMSVDGFDEHEKQYAGMPEWISINDVEKIKFYNPVDSVAIIKKAVIMLKDK